MLRERERERERAMNMRVVQLIKQKLSSARRRASATLEAYMHIHIDRK